MKDAIELEELLENVEELDLPTEPPISKDESILVSWTLDISGINYTIYLGIFLANREVCWFF